MNIYQVNWKDKCVRYERGLIDPLTGNDEIEVYKTGIDFITCENSKIAKEVVKIARPDARIIKVKLLRNANK